MVKPLHVQCPGAVYHVTSRGNGGSPIVFDDQDRLRRLDWLERTVAANDKSRVDRAAESCNKQDQTVG